MNNLEIPYELMKEYRDIGIDLITYLPVEGIQELEFEYYLHDGCYFRVVDEFSRFKRKRLFKISY